MSVTPDHMNAAIAASEARTQALVAEIRGDVKALTVQVQHIDGNVTRLRSNLFTVLLPTVAASVLSILLALLGLYVSLRADNQALISNLQTATSNGRAEGAVQGQILEQLKTLSERVDKLASPPTPAK